MFFLQERDIVTIAPTPSKVNSSGPPCSERHMYEELRKSLREYVRKWSVKHTLRRNLFLPGSLSITQMTTSAYTCTSAFQQKARPNKHPANSQTKSLYFFFFPLLLLFFSGEHAMQNVLSCNHRMFYFHCSECSGGIQRSASVPITANRERRARESAAQRKAPRTKKPKTSSEQARARVVWIFPPESRKFMLKHTSEAIFIFTHYYVIAGTDIKSKVWFKTFRRTSFLISRGTSPVDHGVKMTSLRGRHSARTAINSQLRTRGQHQSAV